MRGLLVTAGLIIAAFLLVILYSEGRKAYWDTKVAEMCEKEGGIKVYKPVELDANEYSALLNRQSQLDLPSERSASPDAKYVHSTKTEYVVRDQLEVRKYVTQVLRRPGPDVLSEKITFSRVGGELFALVHSSSFTCPRQAKAFLPRHLPSVSGLGPITEPNNARQLA
jgi:hypothetical protein